MSLASGSEWLGSFDVSSFGQGIAQSSAVKQASRWLDRVRFPVAFASRSATRAEVQVQPQAEA